MYIHPQKLRCFDISQKGMENYHGSTKWLINLIRPLKKHGQSCVRDCAETKKIKLIFGMQLVLISDGLGFQNWIQPKNMFDKAMLNQTFIINFLTNILHIWFFRAFGFGMLYFPHQSKSSYMIDSCLSKHQKEIF